MTNMSLSLTHVIQTTKWVGGDKYLYVKPFELDPLKKRNYLNGTVQKSDLCLCVKKCCKKFLGKYVTVDHPGMLIKKKERKVI